MSAIERILKAQQAERDAQYLREQRLKVEGQLWSTKYWGEIDQAREQQEVLLVELRKSGIIKLVEEATDWELHPESLIKQPAPAKMTPAQFEEFKTWVYNPPPEEVERRRKVDERYTRRSGWEIRDLNGPWLKEDRKWDLTLGITLLNIREYRLSWRPPHKTEDWYESVGITYDIQRRLKIEGDKITYDGMIPNEGIGPIEDGLVAAMLKPKQPSKQRPLPQRFEDISIG